MREDIRELSNSGDRCRLPAVQRGNVIVADGDAYFSRPGPRLVDGLEMMAHALHPTVHPRSKHGACHRVTDDELGNVRRQNANG